MDQALDPLRVRLIEGGFARCTPSWTCGPYVDASYKFIAPTAGEGIHRLDSGDYPLRPGHWYITPRQRMHQICERRFDTYWFHFVPDHPALEAALVRLTRVIALPARRFAAWQATVRDLPRWFAGGDGDEALACRVQGLALAVLAAVIESVPAAERAAPAAAFARLRPAMELLERDLAAAPSLAALARAAGLSTEYFHRLFVSVYRTTPHQHLISRRMARARALLADPALAIAEVARQCGYDNAFYFSRVFRAFHGWPPRAQRARAGGP